MKVLITAGGTREPIDRVRAITNTSTGATGAALAAALAQIEFSHAPSKTPNNKGSSGLAPTPTATFKTAALTDRSGYSVELLHSATALPPLAASLEDLPPVKGRAPRTHTPNKGTFAAASFTDTASLEAALRARLGTGDIDAVLMAAAIADYRPAEPVLGKLDSDADVLTLRLHRVPKLLPQLRAMSPRPLRVIGFKLTVGATDTERLAAVNAQFRSAQVDAVVHNDLSEIEAAAANGTPHPFRLYTAAPADFPLAPPPPLLLGPAALAAAIHAFLIQPTT